MLRATRSRRLPAAITGSLGAGVSSLRDTATDAAEAIPPLLGAARENLTPRLETALEATKTSLGPRLEAARDVAESRLTDAWTEAAARTRPSRREAKRRAEAAVLALRGDLPVRKRRRWTTGLLFLVAGTAAGAAAGLVVHRKQPEFGTAEVHPPIGSLPTTGGATSRLPAETVAAAEQPDSVTLPEDAPLTD